MARAPTRLTATKVGTRYVFVAIRTLVDPRCRRTSRPSTRSRTRSRSSSRGARASSSRRNGTGEPEQGARRARRYRHDLARLETHVRREGPSIRPAPDRLGDRLGRQSGAGRALSVRLSAEERRQDGLPTHVKDVPVDGFWSISVYNAKGFFEPNRSERVHAEQYRPRRRTPMARSDPVRRLRRQRCELPPDHAGLELHRAALSAAPRDLERHVDISGGETGRTDRRRGRSARPPAAPATNFPKVAKAVPRSDSTGPLWRGLRSSPRRPQ